METFIARERPYYHNECGPQRYMHGADVGAGVDDDGDVVESLRAPMRKRSNGCHDHRRQVLHFCDCESRGSQHWSETRLSMSLMMERSKFYDPFLVL